MVANFTLMSRSCTSAARRSKYTRGRISSSHPQPSVEPLVLLSGASVMGQGLAKGSILLESGRRGRRRAAGPVRPGPSRQGAANAFVHNSNLPRMLVSYQQLLRRITRQLVCPCLPGRYLPAVQSAVPLASNLGQAVHLADRDDKKKPGVFLSSSSTWISRIRF